MNTLLIPAHSPLRLLFLAAQCCDLKATVVEQATRITALEEQGRRDADRIARLIRRNQELTAALHRTAYAG